MDTNPQTIFQKIQYRFWAFILPFLTRGNIYDRSIFSKKDFVAFANKIIKEKGIDHIIITGAPFRLLFYGTLLKQKLPQLKLYCDFRDPWTWGKTWGWNYLSPARKEQENKLENEVMKSADKIFVPVTPMEQHLKSKYPNFKDKIILLPHAFDDAIIKKSFFDNEKGSIPKKEAKIKLIYFGSIYTGLQLSLIHI